MNFLRSLLRGSSQGITIDQNDQSIDYANTAIVIQLFTVRVRFRMIVKKSRRITYLLNMTIRE